MSRVTNKQHVRQMTDAAARNFAQQFAQRFVHPLPGQPGWLSAFLHEQAILNEVADLAQEHYEREYQARQRQGARKQS
jgi:hypothetical protein